MLFVCTSGQPECPNIIYLFIYLFTLHYHGILQLALYIYPSVFLLHVADSIGVYSIDDDDDDYIIKCILVMYVW